MLVFDINIFNHLPVEEVLQPDIYKKQSYETPPRPAKVQPIPSVKLQDNRKDPIET